MQPILSIDSSILGTNLVSLQRELTESDIAFKTLLPRPLNQCNSVVEIFILASIKQDVINNIKQTFQPTNQAKTFQDLRSLNFLMSPHAGGTPTIINQCVYSYTLIDKKLERYERSVKRGMRALTSLEPPIRSAAVDIFNKNLHQAVEEQQHLFEKKLQSVFQDTDINNDDFFENMTDKELTLISGFQLEINQTETEIKKLQDIRDAQEKEALAIKRSAIKRILIATFKDNGKKILDLNSEL